MGGYRSSQPKALTERCWREQRRRRASHRVLPWLRRHLSLEDEAHRGAPCSASCWGRGRAGQGKGPLRSRGRRGWQHEVGQLEGARQSRIMLRLRRSWRSERPAHARGGDEPWCGFFRGHAGWSEGAQSRAPGQARAVRAGVEALAGDIMGRPSRGSPGQPRRISEVETEIFGEVWPAKLTCN